MLKSLSVEYGNALMVMRCGGSPGAGRGAMRGIGQGPGRREQPPHATPYAPGILSLGRVALLDRNPATLGKALLTQA